MLNLLILEAEKEKSSQDKRRKEERVPSSPLGQSGLGKLTIPNFLYEIKKKVNDFDAAGKQCEPVVRKNVPCPPVCVTDIRNCPAQLSVTNLCQSGEFYCQDGQCRSGSSQEAACANVRPVCNCRSGFFTPQLGGFSYFPCALEQDNPKNAKYRTNVTNFAQGDNVGNTPLIAKCATDLNLAQPGSLGQSGAPNPFILQCNPKSVRSLNAVAPEFIFFYSFLVIEAIILLAHNLYKKSAEKKLRGDTAPVKQKKRAFFTVSSDNEVELQDLFSSSASDPDQSLRFTGFRRDLFGQLARYSLLVSSIIWLTLLLILTLDYYGVFASINYAEESFMLFINHDTLSRVFILVWHVVTVWFLTLKIGQARQDTYFGRRCSLLEAEMVLVEKRIETPVYLAGMGAIVEKVRRMEKVLRRATRTDVSVHIVPVKQTSSHNGASGRRYIEFECVRYVYDEKSSSFEQTSFLVGPTFADMHRQIGGLSSAEGKARLELVGANEISFPADTFWTGMVKEFTGYFYIYQMMSLAIWYYYAYYYMGLVLTAVIVISGLFKVSVSIKAQRRVLQMASFHGKVNVLRDSKWAHLSTTELVPGDVIEIRDDDEHILSVDVVLVEGGSVADESSLTGEALPVAKFPVKNEPVPYSREENGKVHSLFAGCRVLQTQPAGPNQPVLAIVTATGANTAKGRLVRDILYPTPISFIFTEHLKIVFPMLIGWGLVMLGLSVWMLGTEGVDSWFYGMFTISQVLSPLLPAVLVIGQSVAAERLRKRGILCVDLQRITLGGKVKIFCFDKTGTLTKEGLDFLGVQPAPVGGSSATMGTTVTQSWTEFPEDIKRAMMSCHSVTTVGTQFVGNFVDIEMFKATKARLVLSNGGGQALFDPSTGSIQGGTTVEPGDSTGTPVHILKRFEFVHAQQYMSVLIRDPTTNTLRVLLKGSFEKIRDLCDPSSLPADYDSIARYHASRGCYVLSFAQRVIPESANVSDVLNSWTRSDLEHSASFIGFILFRNELKESTPTALAELKRGGCRVVMITGDNAQTGIYVAKASGMISKDVHEGEEGADAVDE
ncbi:hypothetical protein HK102_007250, partial [Quaeritorhiza haematococci]